MTGLVVSMTGLVISIPAGDTGTGLLSLSVGPVGAGS